MPLFLLQNFGIKGVYLFAFVASSFLIFISIKAIKSKKITYSGGVSIGKSAVIIEALFLITTIIIIIALLSTFI